MRSHPLWCLVALALMFLTFYVSNSIAQCAACRRSAAARRTHTAARCRTCAEVRRKAACGAARRVRRLATAEATAMHFLFEAFPSSFPHYFVMDTYLVMISDEFLRIQTFKNCGKVEKIFKGRLDSIPSPSPSVKIQFIEGKVYLRCKGKTLVGILFSKVC